MRYFFVIAGVIGFLITGLMAKQHYDFYSNSVVTVGTVVGNKLQPNNDKSTSSTYSPIIEFVTEQNITVTFTAGFGKGPEKYALGDVYEVRYDATYHNNARVNNALRIWSPTFILGLLSCLMVYLAVKCPDIFTLIDYIGSKVDKVKRLRKFLYVNNKG